MKSSPKGSAGSPISPADWFIITESLLHVATDDRSIATLRRCALRLDSDRFPELTDDQQADLLELYSAAILANGGLAP